MNANGDAVSWLLSLGPGTFTMACHEGAAVLLQGPEVSIVRRFESLDVCGGRLIGAVIAMVVIDLVMIAALVRRYPAVTADGLPNIVQSALAVVGGGLALFWTLRVATAASRSFIPLALLGVIVSATTESLNIVRESLVRLPRGVDGVVTLAFMGTTFLTWGVVSFVVARRGGSWPQIVATPALVGLGSMLISVCVGFGLLAATLPQRAREVVEWAEFKRSGLTDPTAFAVISTLDAGASHLVLAPLIGAMFGLAVAFLAETRR